MGHLADVYTGQSAAMRSVYFYVYIFHMPLFIFISGLFSKKIIATENYSKIIPFFFIYIVSKIINFLVLFDPSKDNSFSLFEEAQVPWYALAIAVYLLITIALKKIDKKYVLLFSIVLAVFTGYDRTIGPFLVLSRIIVFFPFFFLGAQLDANRVTTLLQSKKKKWAAWLFLSITAVTIYLNIDTLYFLRAILTGQNAYFHLTRGAEYGGAIRLAYYVIAGLFSMSIIAIMPQNKQKYTTIGQRSLAVYILHYPLMLLMYRLFDVTAILQGILSPHFVFLVFPMAMLLTLLCATAPAKRLVSLLTTIDIK